MSLVNLKSSSGESKRTPRCRCKLDRGAISFCLLSFLAKLCFNSVVKVRSSAALQEVVGNIQEMELLPRSSEQPGPKTFQGHRGFCGIWLRCVTVSGRDQSTIFFRDHC